MEPFARTWLAFVTMERTFLWVPESDPFGEQWCNSEFASALSKKLSWWTTVSGGDCHSYSIGAMKTGKAAGPDGIHGRSIQGCRSSSYWETACLLCSNLGRGSNSQQFSRCSDCLHFQERWYDKLWELSLLSIVGKILHAASSLLPKRPFRSLNVVSDQHRGLLTWFSQHDRFRKSAENRPLYGFYW